MTNTLAISLPEGHTSSDTGKPSRTRGLLRSAKRILSLFLPRKIFDHQQRSEDKVKMSNQQTNHELVVVGSHARLPMNGRGPTVNLRPQLHESNRNNDVRLYRPSMDNQNDHSDIPTYDNPDSYRFETFSRRTDGRNSDSASSCSRISAAVSPGLSTLASAGISTDQTTPSDPQTEFRLPGDDEYIRATSLDRISQVNLSPVSTNSEYSEEVFMVGSNPATKVSALMALDTQASANLMDVELQQELALMMEPCDQELVPLQTKTGKDRIKPFGIAKGVSWHFAQREKTFTSDFLVVDMKNYNAILGRKDIKKLEILKSGPGLERQIRCLRSDEKTVHLKAAVSERLDVNILTQRGLQELGEIQLQRNEISKTVYDSDGVSYTVRDVIRLSIWKKSETKLSRQNFYVSMNDDEARFDTQYDAILGTQCNVGRSSDENALPVAVTQLASQSANDKAAQEKKKREKEEALAKKNQQLREQQKKQASQCR
ncbi:hypothetical protein BO83DRAFT_324832 [Aspergillus eucalypticola CBS 122712]|uniref:Uncharacterized protein n=1 Tax=Aspergillus eucalypticola (strain CBS 122712 / IBT 29274) TaxID=1448314 RepID=A0A317UMH1_ASPEC|nr:uncharacterized protein BO83DRAFT_324832 [Aspergillus eucalypticola CBS 122712]PWY63124.1 hypothetical protein BO83DRAFT_324832 [Aspergillus eucalypticola CBS 122712]